MQTVELKIAKIGNSRGVRIPAEVLRRYAFGDAAILVESVDGILLRPKHPKDAKLSWEDTAKAMAVESEDWSDLDVAALDGLADVPWELAAVAEAPSEFKVAETKASRRKP